MTRVKKKLNLPVGGGLGGGLENTAELYAMTFKLARKMVWSK
jgi:4-diphosphocytidyl-2C-methyl-D-erythritol kinase